MLHGITLERKRYLYLVFQNIIFLQNVNNIRKCTLTFKIGKKSIFFFTSSLLSSFSFNAENIILKISAVEKFKQETETLQHESNDRKFACFIKNECI